MDLLSNGSLTHGLPRSVIHEPEILGHEDGQNGLHAVETESFGSLVADDEGDARGHAGQFRIRGSAVFAHRSWI